MLDPRPRAPLSLFFFYSPGCDACAEAEPELDKFKTAHKDVMVVNLNLSAREWKIDGWAPSATPGYLLRAGTETVKKHTGALTSEELEGMIAEYR